MPMMQMPYSTMSASASDRLPSTVTEINSHLWAWPLPRIDNDHRCHLGDAKSFGRFPAIQVDKADRQSNSRAVLPRDGKECVLERRKNRQRGTWANPVLPSLQDTF